MVIKTKVKKKNWLGVGYLVGQVIIRKHIAEVGLAWFCIKLFAPNIPHYNSSLNRPLLPGPWPESNPAPPHVIRTFQDSYRLILGVNWRLERWFLIPNWYHRTIPLLSKPLICSLTLMKSECVGMANKPISTCRKDASPGWTKSESRSAQPSNFLRST